MKVMVVTESRADREILTKYLVERAHDVQSASDGEAAYAIIDERSCQVAVIDWVTSKRSSTDLIRRLRNRERDEHVYTIVVMSNPTPASVSAAFAAGADDLLRRPFVREELIARVETIDRIRRWAIKMLGDVATRAGDLSSLKAWRAANRAIGTELSDFLDRPLEVRPSTRRARIMAELPISMAEGGLDCRLRVGVDAASLEALARILGVDEASNETLADMVREMANVAGGAMVTAADGEGVALGIGVPTNGDPDRDWSEANGTVQEFALGVPGTTIEFSIRISTQSRELREVSSVDLRPGMVVARSIATHDGVELASAGLRLTESTVATIAERLTPTTKVVVLAAASD